MVLKRDGSVEHKHFRDVADYLRPGDILLLNTTKVIPARLIARKQSGGKADILLMERVDDSAIWEVLARGIHSGKVTVDGTTEAEIWTEEQTPDRRSRPPCAATAPLRKSYLRFLNVSSPEIEGMLSRCGVMPLPPYIKRVPDEDDNTTYQTVYAEQRGSIAAPTAGLHFTEDLLHTITDRGVLVRKLTLHVGRDTFRPITSGSLARHHMDSEYFEFQSSLIDEMREAKASGKRVVAVGTTTTRAVEGFVSNRYHTNGCHAAAVQSHREGKPLVRGYTDIFIYPGYAFTTVDCLITNFHLPRSSPLMLAAALAGHERLVQAYRDAIAMGYRFFSYGDAMLIL
jgi:S-adenosylmethionine:tRNA ribosyltransferase-isomerase